MTYMVQYYNGHSQREKYFNTHAEADEFRLSCGDLTATVWEMVTDG